MTPLTDMIVVINTITVTYRAIHKTPHSRDTKPKLVNAYHSTQGRLPLFMRGGRPFLSHNKRKDYYEESFLNRQDRRLKRTGLFCFLLLCN